MMKPKFGSGLIGSLPSPRRGFGAAHWGCGREDREAPHAPSQNLVADCHEIERHEEKGEGQRHHDKRPEHRGSDRRASEPEDRCRLVQGIPQSTENLMIGMFSAPTSVKIAAARAA